MARLAKKQTIEVLPSDFDNAVCGDATRCLVANAALRHFPGAKTVWVDANGTIDLSHSTNVHNVYATFVPVDENAVEKLITEFDEHSLSAEGFEPRTFEYLRV